MPGATPVGAISEETRRFLAGLPATRRIETVAGPLLLCHGMGTDDMSLLRADDQGYAVESNTELQELIRGGEFRLVANGHAHERMVRSFGRLTVVNGGALLPGKARDRAGFVLVDAAAARAEFLDIVDGRVERSRELDLAGGGTRRPGHPA